MKLLSFPLLLTFFAFCPAFVFGQIRFNPQAGAAFSVVNKTFNLSEINGRAGFTAGFDLRFGEKFFFKPGLYYVQYSNRYRRYETESFEVIAVDENLKRQGLRLPVHIGFDFVEDERLGIRVFGGPNGTFFFSADDPEEVVNEFDYKNVVWGLSAGAGVDVGILTIDLEYEFGLSDMLDSDIQTAKNNALFIRAGLLF
jgi:hypothetical protein